MKRINQFLPTMSSFEQAVIASMSFFLMSVLWSSL
jgi:hypothetical protein